MSTLGNALLFRARAWAGQLTMLARDLAPNHVKPAISSHVEELGDGQYIIRIIADREIAPDARAQEYGSGLHARRGGVKDIIIRPKNKQFLAFPWQVVDGNPNFRRLPDGRVLLQEVHHPGIQAANNGEGYIGPAVKELRARGRAELDADIRRAILSDIRTSFGSKAGSAPPISIIS